MKIKAIYNWLVDHLCEFVTGSTIVRKEIKKSLRSARIVLQFLRDDSTSFVTVGCAVGKDGLASFSGQLDEDSPMFFTDLQQLVVWLKESVDLARV